MTEVRQRQPRIECPAFLAFIRRKPCCACGAPPRSQAAHIRIGNPSIGKRSTGIDEKPSDRWAVPLCAGCHLDAPDAQHRMGDERAFWSKDGIEPFTLAMNLYAQFERRQARSPEQREKVVKRAARMSRKKTRPKITSENRTQFRVAKRKLLKIQPVRGVMRKGMKVTGGPFGPINGKSGKIVSANRWPPRGSRKLEWRR